MLADPLGNDPRPGPGPSESTPPQPPREVTTERTVAGRAAPPHDTPLDLTTFQVRHPLQEEVAPLREPVVAPDGLRTALAEHCARHRVPPVVPALAAWRLLLGRYTGQAEF